jgi:hypothetical protein
VEMLVGAVEVIEQLLAKLGIGDGHSSSPGGSYGRHIDPGHRKYDVPP